MGLRRFQRHTCLRLRELMSHTGTRTTTKAMRLQHWKASWVAAMRTTRQTTRTTKPTRCLRAVAL